MKASQNIKKGNVLYSVARLCVMLPLTTLLTRGERAGILRKINLPYGIISIVRGFEANFLALNAPL
jgi:hypothetical protein